jgi:hypothetical protein
MSQVDDPRDRLRLVLRNAFGDQSVAALDLHLAAATEAELHDVLQEATEARLAFLATAYRECGCAPAESRRRAFVAFAAILGLGVMRGGGTAPPQSGTNLRELVAMFVPEI